MKVLIAALVLISGLAHAQKKDNSAAQQGIAIVEQMEKDLPEFCKSVKKKDKILCDEWFKNQEKSEKKDLSAAQQGIAIVEQMEKNTMLDDFKESCADKNLSAEEKQQCLEYAEYMSHQPVDEMDDRLQGCTMSPDSREITCGDKVYTLSGQVTTGPRLNSKMDLGGSKSKKEKVSNKKGSKQ